MSTNVFAQVETTRAGGGVGPLPTFIACRHSELIRLLSREVDLLSPVK
jgi:hypothetical protein